MRSAFPHLFKPITIGKIEVRNRICMTGHGTGMPQDGTPNDQLIAYYEERAKGEVGLIMLGSQQTHPTSPGITGLLCNYDDRIIPGLARLAQAVQRHGTRIFGYLSHMGFASSARPRGLWSASANFDGKFGEVAHEMSQEEIGLIVQAHAAAALRCVEAGLDGIEIHCGHGLLVQQFLSPLSNHREDCYGGSLENRARFACEILRAVRAAVGGDIPVGIRCSVDELVPGGLGLSDMEQIIPRLVEAGQLDFVDISAGNDGNLVSNMLHEPPMGLAPGPFRSLARQIHQGIDAVTIHGTRIHTPAFAEAMLASGDADMAGMARPLIADAHLPRKARLGRQREIVPCIACEQACFGRLFRGRAISCIASPQSGRERRLADPGRAEHRRRVLVIGGGPGGMETALAAAQRCHDVTLIERGTVLGGRLNLAKLPPGRQEWTRLIEFKAEAIQRAGITLMMGIAASPSLVKQLAPDALVFAAGSVPRPLLLPGARPDDIIDLDQAVTNWHAGDTRLGRRIIVIDGMDRAPALVAALGFAKAGHETVLATSATHVGANLEIQNLTYLYREALSAGVRFLPMVRPTQIEAGELVFENVFTRTESTRLAFDTIVSALPRLPNPDYQALRGAVPGMKIIGDAYAPRDAEAAILEGRETGIAL